MNVSIHSLRVNDLERPMGIDDRSIAFTWKLGSERRGAKQTAFRVMISIDLAGLEHGEGKTWDSGRMEGHPLRVVYDGPPLKGHTRYWWKVVVWDDNEDFAESAPEYFDTGLFAGDWQAAWIWKQADAASWIWKPVDEGINDFAYFRKVVQVRKGAERVKLFVSAHHYLQLFVNGTRVGGYGSPAPTNPRQTKYYLAYDVTELIQEGDNGLAAIVHYLGGDGQNYVNGEPGFLLQGHVAYADGTEEIVVTDKTWETLASIPHQIGTRYQQNRRISAIESLDARKSEAGWTTVDYEGACNRAVMAAAIEGQCWPMKWQTIPEGAVEETIVPVAMPVQEIGRQVFDAGKIVSGWVRLAVKGIEGTTVRLRYSEDLDERGCVKHNVCNEQSEYYYDEYTMSGAEEETWEPSFSYKAFRYVEATGYPELLEARQVCIVSAHTALSSEGSFHSSSSLLNEMYEACVQTQKNNALGQLVDCPHREQAQYLADSDLQAELLLYQFSAAAMLEKVLADFADGQLADGTFPFMYPSNYEHPSFHIQIPEWDLHFLTILWKLYRFTGDKRTLERYYTPAKKTLLHYFGRTDFRLGLVPQSAGVKPRIWHISDHPYQEIDESGKFLAMQNMKLAHGLKLMADMAGILGYASEAEQMTARFGQLSRAICDSLYDAERKRLRDSFGSACSHQGTNAVALHYDFVPPEDRETLLDTIAEQGLQTKTLLSLNLLHVLFQNGREEEGYRLLTKTDFPGWGYMIRQGSRTIWEGFGDIESHCHAWNAYPARMMVEYIAGIQVEEAGWERIRIKPYVPQELEHAEGRVMTPRGLVSTGWKKTAEGEDEGFRLQLQADIPVGTEASVWIPAEEADGIEIRESGTLVWSDGTFRASVAGITGGNASNSGDSNDHKAKHREPGDAYETRRYVVLQIRSGSYAFECRPA
ncbi:alpha-L-rhamnosidase [Paenibacillus contaminans]|uniref:alpha-L-rhamnosidase n=1 Tax=Paenibacillus contaminans TaxID=450362 RepID=A0A329MGG0_9BACL|nr:alpha-L-rhamnosidase [Paenibacillus contaminans]RAV18989.1 alpha-L-rhamnosidase [Paenibacillus contaminans]